MEKDYSYGHAGHSKLGPREKGRKCKGRTKPQAIRQAKARRDNFLQKVKANG